MATSKSSLVRRTLVQIDRAFWCLHEYPRHLAVLALPTLVASALLTLLITTVARTWILPAFCQFILFGMVYPWIAVLIFTFAPLPGAVFAWHGMTGNVLSPGRCFAWCFRRRGRLAKALLLLGSCYFMSFVLLGVPLLFYWPRTCMVPLVALFEDEKQLLRRSRRLLREDTAVLLLGVLVFCFLAVLGGLLFSPRLLLGIKSLQTTWTRAARDYVWIVEVAGGGMLLSVMALTWCISLTLLYRDIRWMREGEALREKLQRLGSKYLGKSETASVGNLSP
jgi:hypothetical protein